MNKLTSLCFAIVLIATSCKKEDVSPASPYIYEARFLDYGEVAFTSPDGVQVERCVLEFGRSVILDTDPGILARSLDRYVNLPDGNFRVFLQIPNEGNGFNGGTHRYLHYAPYTWTDGQGISHADTLRNADLDRFPNWYAYDRDTCSVSIFSGSTVRTVRGPGEVSLP